MKVELLKKIDDAVHGCYIRIKKRKGYWLWMPMPAKTRKRIMDRVRKDSILPMLELRVNARVKCVFVIDEEDDRHSAIELEVGRRDFSFSPKGAFWGSGTFLG